MAQTAQTPRCLSVSCSEATLRSLTYSSSVFDSSDHPHRQHQQHHHADSTFSNTPTHLRQCVAKMSNTEPFKTKTNPLHEERGFHVQRQQNNNNNSATSESVIIN